MASLKSASACLPSAAHAHIAQCFLRQTVPFPTLVLGLKDLLPEIVRKVHDTHIPARLRLSVRWNQKPRCLCGEMMVGDKSLRIRARSAARVQIPDVGFGRASLTEIQSRQIT
jgi:hypothetical protein